jgi:hypothetical protein
LKKQFTHPDVSFRPMMQWSWNGHMTPKRIGEQLEQFARQGCGGVFIYPRPGFQLGYLLPEWFALWRVALEQCRRLGLQCHIYDEFTCFSGHAGGQVVKNKPYLAAQVLRPEPVPQSTASAVDFWETLYPTKSYQGDPLGYFRLRSGGAPEPISPDQADRGDGPAQAVTLCPTEPRGNGFAVPDLTRRETTETFLQTTHEQYARTVGDSFGQECRFVFTDEPQLVHHNGLICSREILKEFRRDHGYDLTDRLGELCFTQEGSRAVRFDYFSTLNRLFLDNFMKPIHDWCGAHNLEFSGHLVECCWPRPTCQPDVMAAMRWMQAPGTDMLGFQFKPTRPEDNGHWILVQAMLRSVGRQLGRKWLLTESCGANGYGYDVAQFKPLEDFLLAYGVNVLDPHLTHETLSGARKWEWPQTLGDHSPWWTHYHRQADHTGRVNAMLCAGQDQTRVLMLLPTTTAWLYYQAKCFRPGFQESNDKMDHMRSRQDEICHTLAGMQIDFDFGDEFILAELASPGDATLRVGQAEYDVLLLPDTLENVTAETLDRLEAYLQAGGRVLALGAPPAYVNGRPSQDPARLAQTYSSQWTLCEDLQAMGQACRQIAPPPVSAPDGSTLPKSLVWRRVALPDGKTFYFLCNPFEGEIETEIRLPGQSIQAFHTDDGTTAAQTCRIDGDCVIAPLHLPQWGHVLWLVSPEPGQAPVQIAQPATGVACRLQDVKRVSDNLMQIDYCDIAANGHQARDVATIKADTMNWPWQGLDSTPWRASQFERITPDRPADPESDLRLTYRFQVAEDLPDAARNSLRMGIERIGLYQVRLNGQLLNQAPAKQWFDEEMHALPIGAHVRGGWNELELYAKPFTVFSEIKPVILIGDYRLAPAEKGFVVHASGDLDLGDWTAQGLPFYHERLAYAFEIDVDETTDALEVELDYRGALAEVELDAREVGAVLHPPYKLRIDEQIPAGTHKLTVKVIGNMKNFMGPFFSDAVPGPWAWGDCPEHMPPGESYRFYPVGLMAPPQLRRL